MKFSHKAIFFLFFSLLFNAQSVFALMITAEIAPSNSGSFLIPDPVMNIQGNDPESFKDIETGRIFETATGNGPYDVLFTVKQLPLQVSQTNPNLLVTPGTFAFAIDKFVTNNTGNVWTDFKIDLLPAPGSPAAIFETFLFSPEDASGSFSQITPSGTSLLFEGGAVNPGERIEARFAIQPGRLEFTGNQVTGDEEFQFILRQSPTGTASVSVPEPGPFALLMMAFLFARATGRRKHIG